MSRIEDELTIQGADSETLDLTIRVSKAWIERYWSRGEVGRMYVAEFLTKEMWKILEKQLKEN